MIDDALSALDAYVGKKIMDKVFKGVLGGKTRIMVTHYLHLLSHVDKVVLMDKGKIAAFGTYEEVRNHQAFVEFANSKAEDNSLDKSALEESLTQNQSPEKTELTTESALKLDKKSVTKFSDEGSKSNSEEDIHEKEKYAVVEEFEGAEDDDDISEIQNIELDSKKEPLLPQKDKLQEEKAALGKITQKEGRQEGQAGIGYYGYYLKSSGVGLSILAVLFYSMAVMATMSADWWIGKWGIDFYKISNSTYKTIYMFIGGFCFLISCLRSVTMGYLTELASFRIFKRILWNVLRRPMSFFDTTPSGVIINRCVSDIDQIDFAIPFMLGFFMTSFFNMLAAVILVSVFSPLIVLFVVVGFSMLRRSFDKYFRTAVELKRLASVSTSPMISKCSEFIEGVTVIRTYNKRDDFMRKFTNAADTHHTAFLNEEMSNTWLRFRVDAMLIVVVALTILTVVINTQFK